MKIKIILTAFTFFLFSLNNNLYAQTLKEKMKASKEKLASKVQKDNSEAFECGYVHKETLAEKANPMKALQKSLGGSVTNGSNPDLGTAAISVFYQAHLHPQNIMKYPTKIPGWETCGDAVFLGFTNKAGTGLSSTDGKVYFGDVGAKESERTEIAFSGIGTYFQGFNPSKRGAKEVIITSSNGDKVEVMLEPVEPIEIKSIDGKAKGEEVIIDGTKDIVIELNNGDADPTSKLHVQMICKLVGTPIIYDVIVVKANNKIYIPKEAFKNFEGSPSPFAKNNVLIVNRVKEAVINGTDAGALQTICAYMDWAPISVGGDLSKGNAMTMGFDTTKNTNLKIELVTEGEYNYSVKKDGPYISPPVKLMKNVAVASFVVRGNLSDKKVSSTKYTITETTKWFPQLSDETWQNLADNMYAEFKTKLESTLNLNILPLDVVIQSEAYKHTKPIKDGSGKNFVEVGAGGTKRILTSSFNDLFTDLSISFPSDFVSERLVKELDVDAVIAVTVDLNFNFESEGLDPQISIVAFAPNVSYKTPAKYFTINGTTEAKSLSESKNLAGSVEEVLYQMIKAEDMIDGFSKTLNELSNKEDQSPVYEKLWKAKL